jgi:hypothetical protein
MTDYTRILNILILDAEAKHVPRDVDFPLRDRLLALATAAKYPYPFMGQHQGLTAEQDRIYVTELAQCGSFRPLKFVITKDGRVWADNTHWTLAALLRHGGSTTVGAVPSYLIDLRGSKPVLFNAPATLLGSMRERATQAALSIEERLRLGWRPADVSFRIRDLSRLGGYGT